MILALRMLCKRDYRISIVLALSCGLAKNDSNTLRVDAYFFENGEQSLCFQKYTDTCGQNQVELLTPIYVGVTATFM